MRKPKEIIDYYKGTDSAEIYENKRYVGVAGRYRKRLAAYNFQKIMGPNDLNYKDVLEIAPGTGVLTKYVLDEYPNTRLTCLDSSDKMLSYLDDNFSDKYGNLTLRMGDAKKLPFDDKTFDIVYSFRLLVHYDDPHKYLAEMMRVLKPGGVVIIDAHNIFRIDFAMTFFRRYISGRGFSFRNGVESYYLYPWEIRKKYFADGLIFKGIIGNKLIPPSSFLLKMVGEDRIFHIEKKLQNKFTKYLSADCYIKLYRS